MSWLTVKIGRFIHSALSAAKDAKTTEQNESKLASVLSTDRSVNDPIPHETPRTQFTVAKVVNGTIIIVAEYKPTKSHHSDWVNEIHIVKDDERVPDVIARIMAIKALEQ